MVFKTRRIVRRRQRYGGSYRRLDWLSAFERTRKECRTGTRRRRKSLDHQYRHLLRRLAVGRLELYHHAVEYAHARDDTHAHAAHLLGVVYDRNSRIAFISGLGGRRHPLVARSNWRHELL